MKENIKRFFDQIEKIIDLAGETLDEQDYCDLCEAIEVSAEAKAEVMKMQMSNKNNS